MYEMDISKQIGSYFENVILYSRNVIGADGKEICVIVNSKEMYRIISGN